jgi:acyl-CoA thioesterase
MMNLQELAQAVGQSMFAADRASRETMGMELIECSPGRAVMRMMVTDAHLNGHQICHLRLRLQQPQQSHCRIWRND